MKKIVIAGMLFFLCMQGCGMEDEIQHHPVLKGTKKSVMSSLPSFYNARWSGVAQDGPWSYNVTLSLSGAQLRYRYVYPSISATCQGILSVTSVTSSEVLLAETLNTDTSFEGCLTGGYVRLRAKNKGLSNRALFAWLPSATSTVTDEYVLNK